MQSEIRKPMTIKELETTYVRFRLEEEIIVGDESFDRVEHAT